MVLKLLKKLHPKSISRVLKYTTKISDYELDSSGNPITDDDYKIETGLIAQEIMTIPELKYLVSETEDKYEIIEDYKKDSNGNFILQ